MSPLCVLNSSGVCSQCGEKANPSHRKTCPKFVEQNPTPVKVAKPRKGVGTFVSSLLSAFGIKKTPGCGCYQREQKLNELGWRIKGYFSRKFNTKSRRRKKLQKQIKASNPFSSQEKSRAEAKELRRQYYIDLKNQAKSKQ